MDIFRQYIDFIIFVEQVLLMAFLVAAMVKIRRVKKERNRHEAAYWELVQDYHDTLDAYYSLKAESQGD